MSICFHFFLSFLYLLINFPFPIPVIYPKQHILLNQPVTELKCWSSLWTTRIYMDLQYYTFSFLYFIFVSLSTVLCHHLSFSVICRILRSSCILCSIFIRTPEEGILCFFFFLFFGGAVWLISLSLISRPLTSKWSAPPGRGESGRTHTPPFGF